MDRMTLSGALAISLIVVALAPRDARAAGSVDGELHVSLANAEYVTVKVNGVDYDNIEFERDGKELIVYGLDAGLEHNRLTLTPREWSALAPFELVVDKEDFERVRKKGVFYLVAHARVTFESASDSPAKAPEPDVPEVAPPAPQEDDL